VTQDRNDYDAARPQTTEAVEAMSDDEQAEVAEIRAEIEETRTEMGGTLNELGDRLEPSHLVEQAKENVREATIGRVENAAKGATDMVMDTIKQNPIPAAMAAAGLALLWANRSQDNAGRGSFSRSGYGYQSRPESSYAGSPSGGLGATARDAASTVTDAVGTVAEGAQQATGEVIGRAGETAQQVSWKLESFMQANPLAVGAIAVGAGALIGSLVPETEKEREVLGDATRQVGTIVRDTVDQAATKAEETLDQAEEKVTSPA
jgi:hypothetical protein